MRNINHPTMTLILNSLFKRTWRVDRKKWYNKFWIIYDMNFH
jgi:hypothetical protein